MRETLTDLRAEWRTLESWYDVPGPVTVLRFMCPTCSRNAQGFSHWIGVPVSDDGAARTWKRSSSDLETVSLSPSVNTTIDDLTSMPMLAHQGCRFHGFVTNGYVE